MKNMRLELIDQYSLGTKNMEKIFSDPLMRMRYAEAKAQQLGPGATAKQVLEQCQNDQLSMHQNLLHAKESKTVIFSAEQAKMFSAATRDYTERLDYRLPFPFVFLQFSEPLEMPIIDTSVGPGMHMEKLIGIFLTQSEFTEETKAQFKRQQNELNKNPYNLLGVSQIIMNAEEGGVLNAMIAVWEDFNSSRFSWFSDASYELAVPPPNNDTEKTVQDAWTGLKRLAISCIGYINCENVYLELQGVVPAAVNNKRAGKGKHRLEPYYVCKITGVQYGANGTERDAGSKHSIRYDVRGHFRRLDGGKTIWVRPHQRGIENELYVPKMYAVAKP